MLDDEDKPGTEFFYLEADGSRGDRELHGPIIAAVDNPVNEKIMEPIRAKHRARWLEQRKDGQQLDSLSAKVAPSKSSDYIARGRDFDPSQPRDDHGRWTETGAADEGTGEAERERERTRRQSGARSPDEASRRAAQAASGKPSLEGLPSKPLKVGEFWYTPGPLAKAKDAADAYMRDAGLAYDPPKQFAKVDKERATRIAAEYDKMKHAPADPAVQASYEALANETLAQWQAIKKTGFKVEWIGEGQPDPYAVSPRMAAIDIIDNNHWWGFPTDAGYGSGDEETETARSTNPMLRMTDEVVGGRQLRINDVFRIVHDYFGHFKEGVGFRADGEENAWRQHAAMYSPLARGAMTSETRGQNSWVNYGPHGETNRTASSGDTVYAPQKIGLMPEWTWYEGSHDSAEKERRRAWDESKHPREPAGTSTGGQFASDGGGDSDGAPDVGGFTIQDDFSFSRGKTDQDVKSLDELYERSKAVEASFKAGVDQIAQDTGGNAIYTPAEFAEPGTTLKSRASAERKMHKEENGDPTKLRDILRATIEHETVQQSRGAALRFIQEQGDNIVRVKDRIVNPLQGYRDILINFRTEGGIIAEVQFSADDMLKTKFGEGHKIYEQLRELQTQANVDPQVIIVLQQQSVALYDDAYKRDGNGSWGRR
jgi:hypothetical protein